MNVLTGYRMNRIGKKISVSAGPMTKEVCQGRDEVTKKDEMEIENKLKSGARYVKYKYKKPSNHSNEC